MHHADPQTDTGMQLDVQGGPHHSYLLMSSSDSSKTKVFDAGDELAEMPSGGCFMRDVATIAAGNVLNHTLILQVRPLVP